MDGFGFLVPSSENSVVLGMVANSNTFQVPVVLAYREINKTVRKGKGQNIMKLEQCVALRGPCHDGK